MRSRPSAKNAATVGWMTAFCTRGYRRSRRSNVPGGTALETPLKSPREKREWRGRNARNAVTRARDDTGHSASAKRQSGAHRFSLSGAVPIEVAAGCGAWGGCEPESWTPLFNGTEALIARRAAARRTRGRGSSVETAARDAGNGGEQGRWTRGRRRLRLRLRTSIQDSRASPLNLTVQHRSVHTRQDTSRPPGRGPVRLASLSHSRRRAALALWRAVRKQ